MTDAHIYLLGSLIYFAASIIFWRSRK